MNGPLTPGPAVGDGDMMKLPKKLYVRAVDDRAPWFSADATLAAVIDEDGPSTIGVYALVETVRAEKIVRVTPGKKPRGR